MRKSLIGVAGAITGTLMMSTAANAGCGEVSITNMNWASAQVVTAVSKFIMEQGYGCKVTLVPSATVTAVASMSETNKPDIATEVWVNSAALYPKLVKAGKVVTLAKVLSDGGEENWWIPQYLADAHPELKTVADVLKNPKVVGGRFHNCPVGWGCRIANDHLVKAWKFKEAGMEVFNHGSGETLATSIASAYASKKPWFGYYWAPTAVLGKYKMKKIDMGPYDAKIHKCNQSKDCKTPGKSSYPAAPVLTAATTSFVKREPAIAELMKHVSFTNAQMGEILAWKKEKKATADQAAVYFLTKYKKVWANWLNDDARKKLAAILK